MREPDWFLRWFMYCIMAAFAIVCLMMSQVYAKSTWDEYLKDEVVAVSYTHLTLPTTLLV